MKIGKMFLYIIVISLIFSAGLVSAEEKEEPKVTAKVNSSASLVSAEEKEKPKVAAKVNSKEILIEEVDFFIAPELERMEAMGQQVTPEVKKNFRNFWVEQSISRELMIQKAVTDKVVITDEEVEKTFTKTENKGSTLPADKLKQFIKEDLMIDKIIENNVMSKIVVSDKDVEDFYNSRKNEMKESEQVKARHILILEHTSDSTEKKEENKKKVETVLAEVKAGKTDFSELAKKYSECPSAPNGGDLGFFARGQMVSAFESAAFALKPGEISDVIQTQFGYHIIKAEDRKEERVLPFEEVKELIRENIKREKGNGEIAKMINELKSKATIEIME